MFSVGNAAFCCPQNEAPQSAQIYRMAEVDGAEVDLPFFADGDRAREGRPINMRRNSAGVDRNFL
jgi:hypothetical protein